MKCPKCRFENPEDAKFCNECGTQLELVCPECGKANAPKSKFCNECGNVIEPHTKLSTITPERDIPHSVEPTDTPVNRITPLDGERKHATVLFSDLSGYTAMSEKLDPEKVKDIMGRIFTEAGKIADKYDATVEKFFGDEIMVLLGVPKAHEDDPVRAINMALEIHERVTNISPEHEKETGVSLTMHTGINTGLVITGDRYIGKSRHGLTGDTINLAKRLTGLAESGEIVVGPDTYHQSSGYFNFEDLKPTEVKGKAEPVQAYRVISPKAQPRKIHRLQGVRAKLIGRKVEMGQLQEAAERLREGRGAVFSIVGTAGTGKSRLVEEFKASLNLEKIHWREGHAYPYTQNTPYFPLINLLSRAFEIKEGDSPEKMREKIETGVAYLMGEDQEAAPYIGSLFSLSYPEINEVSPEFWKSKLQQSVQSILSALAKMGPTVICLEDFHWADPSFLDLIRHILSDFREPVLFLCIYRPIITLFPSHQITSMATSFQEIRIQDLSTSESQDMLESLLNTDNIPDELRRFVQTKIEGNPFYLEEVINSFIESKTLIRENENWRVTRPITEEDISASIHGVISARLDRLELETKRILQQAAVIGRVFYYEILNKIKDLKGNIAGCLSGLERLDLIKTRSMEPDLEYIFKHALTQEVVYNGLLKKERQKIHERIGLVMEQLFHDRLPEFYETLAFHFKHGESLLKAVDFLAKSGEKAIKRYAVQEAHQYYEEGFSLLTSKPIEAEENKILIDLLIKWSLVYYCRGDFFGMSERLKAHKDQADLLDDKETKGMFYAWLGFSYWFREDFKSTYEYSNLALRLGEDADSKKLMGYAYMFLAFACLELGYLDQAISNGQKAHDIGKELGSDQYLFFKPLWAVALAYLYMGEVEKNHELTQILLDYGKRHSNIRCLVVGHLAKGFAYYAAGHYPASIDCLKRALDVSAEPWYSHCPRVLLGLCYLQTGELGQAEKVLRVLENYSKSFGCEYMGTISMILLGVVEISKGEMSKGLKMIEEAHQSFYLSKRKYSLATAEFILASIYSQIALGQGGITPSRIIKNIGFLVKNIPFAGKKAEKHFNNAIQISRKIGAKGIMGQAYLELGILHKAKKGAEKAKKCISEAVQLFEQCEAEVFLKQAHEELESLR